MFSATTYQVLKQTAYISTAENVSWVNEHLTKSATDERFVLPPFHKNDLIPLTRLTFCTGYGNHCYCIAGVGVDQGAKQYRRPICDISGDCHLMLHDTAMQI